MRVLVLLLVAVAITAAHANSFMKHEVYLTDQERTLAMDESIQEAMVVMEARRIAEKNAVPSNKKIDYTSIQLLHRLFKRPSEEAKKLGKADHLYRDIVDRAERKMLEVKRAKVEMSQGRDESTLYQRPGSIITSAELTRAWQVARNVIGVANEDPNCDYEHVDLYRSIDGTCNNLENPRLGSSTTAFRRIVPAVYQDEIRTLRGSNGGRSFSRPSARRLSMDIVTEKPPNTDEAPEEIPFTHLLMQFGQFLDHDMDLGPEVPVNDKNCKHREECENCQFASDQADDFCQPIQVPENDPVFKANEGEDICIPFRRSLGILSAVPPLELETLEQVNDVTSFIDGSMIYGSDLCTSLKLRLRNGGLLREGQELNNGKPALPVDNGGVVLCRNAMDCFLCGDVRCNEQTSLTIMHTLWLREHNRCARAMTEVNPHWEDERLYQECRKIVGALIQKIVYKDYLPKVLGPSNIDKFIPKYEKYNKDANPSIPNCFATAAYRYGHSLVRPTFSRYNDQNIRMEPLKLEEAFFKPDNVESLGVDSIMRGWVNDNSLRMDEFMNTILTTKLFETPTSHGLDLASLNIQRGRDHGLPVYSVFKDICVKEFDFLNLDDFVIEKDRTKNSLITRYGGSIDGADVWLAGIAEKRLDGGLLGPTFACIFGITFKSVRDGDRFFWENEGVFTPIQKDSIEEDSFSRVICTNSDKIELIQSDAFVSNLPPESCTKRKQVQYELFKENDCHIRVKLSVRRRRRCPRITLNGIPVRRGCKCIPVECPTNSKSLSIKIVGNRPFTVSNPNDLRRKIRRGKVTYTLEKSLLYKRSGVFATRTGCEMKRNEVAFTIRKRRRRRFPSMAANEDDLLEEELEYDDDSLEEELEYDDDSLEEELEYDDDSQEEDLQDDELESENLNAKLESIMEVTSNLLGDLDRLGNAEKKRWQDLEERAKREEALE